MPKKINAKVPLVSLDLPRGRLLNHLISFGVQPERDQQQGRFASYDRVAMCLLRRDMDSVMPMRREVQIARNRRHLKWALALVMLWWLAGRFFI